MCSDVLCIGTRHTKEKGKGENRGEILDNYATDLHFAFSFFLSSITNTIEATFASLRPTRPGRRRRVTPIFFFCRFYVTSLFPSVSATTVVTVAHISPLSSIPLS